MEPRPSKLNPVCAQPTEWWRNLKEIHTDPRCGVLSLRRWHRENTHEENKNKDEKTWHNTNWAWNIIYWWSVEVNYAEELTTKRRDMSEREN